MSAALGKILIKTKRNCVRSDSNVGLSLRSSISKHANPHQFSHETAHSEHNGGAICESISRCFMLNFFFGLGGLLLCKATLRCIFILRRPLHHPTCNRRFLNNHGTFSHSVCRLAAKVPLAIILVLVSSNNSDFQLAHFFARGLLLRGFPRLAPTFTPHFLNNHLTLCNSVCRLVAKVTLAIILVLVSCPYPQFQLGHFFVVGLPPGGFLRNPHPGTQCSSLVFSTTICPMQERIADSVSHDLGDQFDPNCSLIALLEVH